MAPPRNTTTARSERAAPRAAAIHGRAGSSYSQRADDPVAAEQPTRVQFLAAQSSDANARLRDTIIRIEASADRNLGPVPDADDSHGVADSPSHAGDLALLTRTLQETHALIERLSVVAERLQTL